MLHALAERDDVIALALHVDYWDYIGWKDVFAQAKFSKRQREYAVVGGTPLGLHAADGGERGDRRCGCKTHEIVRGDICPCGKPFAC